MTEHPNSFLVHQCLQALNEGDTETLRALWTHDILWQVKGPSPWQGDIQGPDAIFEYLGEFAESGVEAGHIEVEDVMVGDDRAAIVLAVKAEHDGRSLETNYALIARIAGRRVHEVITIPFDAEQVAAFWQL